MRQQLAGDACVERAAPVALLVALALPGCGGDDASTGPSTEAATAETVSVVSGGEPGCEATDECFIPDSVAVRVGGTVTWENDSSSSHTVTSGTPAEGPDGVFDSGLFLPGSSFQHVFAAAGTFDYLCMVHPWEVGKVVVVP